ncbi:6-pyruvoyl-tetrahydropterin synthase-related protein [Aeromonas sp. R6-2]|uniref:6-pyruvoyl-tetrahydropterin synthase-related protein n=1 Tax=unclassified Aeromonas TaxID=257493 RepID=UPI0034A1F554
MGKRWMTLSLGCIALTALLLILPLWLRGGSQGHDLFHHLLSGHYFALQLWQGELYPRWLMAMNGGFGSPTFFFYPPLPYYVSALLGGATPQPHDAMTALIASATLALGLSGLTFWLWIRSMAGPMRALVASLIYMALPYHLAIDLYARFALAEVWAFVWLPLILLGQDRYMRTIGVPLMALGLALLTLSHLPSLLLAICLVLLRALIRARRDRLWRPLLTTLGATLLGLAMAALLLAPALLDQGGISMAEMQRGMFDFRRNFLDRLPTAFDDWRFRGQLALFTLLTLFTLLLAWAGAREPRHPELPLWGGFGVLAFMMMLPQSQLLWELLVPLQRVQFPWRANLILTLATAAVVALASPSHPNSRVLVGSTLLLTLLFSASYVRHAPLTQSPNPEVLDFEFDSKRSAREYRPKQVPKGMFSPSLLAWKQEFQPPVVSEQAGVSWRISRWQPRHLALTVTTPTPAKLVLHQYDYPGWQAWLDGEYPLEVSANRQGLLQVWVPEGTHTLKLVLSMRWPERIGYLLSALAWALWGALLWRARRARY